MGKIEVNEYVRTNKIIARVIGKDDDNNILLDTQQILTKTEEKIVNHSKQLIELIEVKDLVCFRNKLPNSLENEEMIIHIFDNDTLEEVKQAIEREEIELLEILTHEQSEQNSDRVGDKYEQKAI